MISSYCMTEFRRTHFESAWISFLHSGAPLLHTAKSTHPPQENGPCSIFSCSVALVGISTAWRHPSMLFILLTSYFSTQICFTIMTLIVERNVIKFSLTGLFQPGFNPKLTVGRSWLNQSQRCCAILPIKYSVRTLIPDFQYNHRGGFKNVLF